MISVDFGWYYFSLSSQHGNSAHNQIRFNFAVEQNSVVDVANVSISTFHNQQPTIQNRSLSQLSKFHNRNSMDGNFKSPQTMRRFLAFVLPRNPYPALCSPTAT